MSDLVLLPSTRYQPPSTSQDRRQGRALNTIMEEDAEDGRAQAMPGMQRTRHNEMKIEQWLSPLSDHFPTPRGFHFLAAPVLPSSPSNVSADDDDASVSDTNSSNPSSNPWNRVSVMTDGTEFDDLYDLSDEEERAKRASRAGSLKRQSSVRSNAHAHASAAARRSLPRLEIPTRNGSGDSWSDLKKLTSPVPPTPPTRVAMSPAVMDFMQVRQTQDIPTISAPPSLDGSLTSEQMAAMSAPPTPVIGSNEDDGCEEWAGVQLQPGALETLQALSGNDEFDEQPDQLLEIPHEPIPEMQQQPLRLMTSFQAVSPGGLAFSPLSHRASFAGLTRLDIPSPGGFFSDLSPRTRRTWDHPKRSPDEMVPPTSTTAEQFYKAPWNMDDAPALPLPPPPPHPPMEQFYRPSLTSSPPVEHVVEVQDDTWSDGDQPTARPVLPHSATVPKTASSSSATLAEPSSPDAEYVATEIVVDYDPEYARKQQEVALSNLDRTELWLMAQNVYLQPVISPETEREEEENEIAPEVPPKGTLEKEPEPVVPKKKTVRFSDAVIKANDIPRSLPSKLVRHESAYYRAFQDFIIRSRREDVFVHRLPRFEALQAQRISLPEMHRNQLLGKYQLSVVPQSAKKRLSANVARGDDVLVDDPYKLKREKEVEALAQMATSTWHVGAVRMLNGGRLISAPISKRLARLSRPSPGPGGLTRDRARILDLGGQATCDWAWHCAMQFPNTKVYTVTTKAIRQLSNCNIRGPPNHRQVAVERLTRLPFQDDQFDLISARELHNVLKFVGENGEDEWESCLRECMRVLKPGGYLEFSILDSDIINAGPLGLAKSVEFGFTLKRLGYDPSPSKMWLGRLSRAGFDEVRRAWLCLPMGERRRLPALPPSASTSGRTVELEAMVTGSSDGIASVCGLVGGWSWERWLLCCEMEKVAGELRLSDTVTTGAAMLEAGKCLEGVHAVVEEGRNCGSGWRMLNGYARKPKPGTGLIQIKLA